MRFSSQNVHKRGEKSPQSAPPSRAQTSYCLTFPRSIRLCKKEHFRKVMYEHKSFIGKAVVFYFCASTQTRLGITVPKTYGIAVKRNCFKRLVREVFRKNHPMLPPMDIVILPKKGGIAVSFESIQQDFFLFTHFLANSGY